MSRAELPPHGFLLEIVAPVQQSCFGAPFPAARERAIHDTPSNRCGDAETKHHSCLGFLALCGWFPRQICSDRRPPAIFLGKTSSEMYSFYKTDTICCSRGQKMPSRVPWGADDSRGGGRGEGAVEGSFPSRKGSRRRLALGPPSNPVRRNRLYCATQEARAPGMAASWLVAAGSNASCPYFLEAGSNLCSQAGSNLCSGSL